MKAVSPYTGAIGSGKPQAATWTDVPEPELGAGEALVEVRAAALNRGDLLQLRGLYPPPPGASEVPGLEAAGVIVGLGEREAVAGETGAEEADGEFAVGDEVIALLSGGGQAERVAVPLAQLMRKPKALSWAEAGGFAEVALTSWTNLVYEGGLAAGQTVLITAAASGVGTYCVQLAKALGATVLVAGRKRPRLERLMRLGADGIVVLGDDLPMKVREFAPDGVDLVIDLVGGQGFGVLLGALKNRGRIVLVGVLGGVEAEVPLGEILRRRLEIRGSVLRSRSVGEKAGLIRSFESFARSHLAQGELKPVVDRVLPFEQVEAAYRSLGTEEIYGKIVMVSSVGRQGD